MNLSNSALTIYWLSVAALAYTYVGYAVLMRGLAAGRSLVPSMPESGEVPSVSVVIVAFNEQERIRARIANILASEYPADRLDVIVVSDGSTDSTAASVREFSEKRVDVIERPTRSGKAACLNAAFAHVSGTVVVLADARQRFAADTIHRLVRHFADPKIGAASGSLEIEAARSAVGRGVGSYWKMEKALRESEARWDSCIGCTGAVYAVRRNAFEPIPEDTLLDDVVIPMQIARKGFRVLHDAEATAYDPQPLEPEAESRRKRRTLAGNFQMLFRYPTWLMPGGHRLWWQLISHKYLRLAAPLLLATVLLANLALLSSPWYQLAFIAQCAFYLAALVGRFTGASVRVLALPAGFVFLNLSVLSAAWHYFRGGDLQRWETRRA